MELEDKLAICKLVTHAIMADHRITDEEYALWGQVMDRYELDEEQRAAVRASNVDDEVAELIAGTSEAGKRKMVEELAEAVRVDGEVSRQERELVIEVANLLGFEASDIFADGV